MRKALFKIREKMRRREFILGTNTTFNDACVTELLGVCGFDFISGFVTSVGEHVEIAVDTLLLETVDKIIETLHASRIKFSC